MIAHALTSARLLSVVPAAWAYSRPERVPVWVFAAILTVAIVTDVYDGKVARATGSSSPAGMLFDHTTDFLFVTAGLAAAAMAGLVPAVLPALIVVAFSQYVVDSYFLHRQKQLRMSAIGRWNGILYFVPLVEIALGRIAALPVLPELATALVRPCGLVLVATTVVSIADRALATTRRRPST